MSDADNLQRLIDDLRSDGHEVFAERLEALRARQVDTFASYRAMLLRQIDLMRDPILLDATVGMRRGV